MAKEDFCFTYYDGDAARDKAHMTRLQRGAYDDIISAQRKRGHLSVEDIKRVLSKDFDECWPALEWVLLKDEEGKFFIEWVDKSISKMKANSQKNSDRIKQYWEDVKSGKIARPQKKTKNHSESIPRNNHGLNPVIPLENGNGDGNGKEYFEEGPGETFNPEALVPEMAKTFVATHPDYPIEPETDYPALLQAAERIKKWLKIPGLVTDMKNRNAILKRWGELVMAAAADSHLSRYSISQINKHFQSVVQNFNNGRTTINRTGPAASSPGKSAGAKQLVSILRDELTSNTEAGP